MKKCASCGAEVSDSSVLCPICGGFTDKMEENTAENIIKDNISENSNDMITDINELLKDDIPENITKPEPVSENTENISKFTPNENISTEKEPETVQEIKTEPEKKEITQPEIKQPETEKKPETSTYVSYNIPNEKADKKNKKSPLWLIILLILLILAICVICAIMVIKYFVSGDENNEPITENTTAISSEMPSENESDEENSETSAVAENSESNDETVSNTVSETVEGDATVETLKKTVSQNYSDVTLVYDESANAYTINIYDAKVTEKILTIQNTSDENNEYDTLTSELTDECKKCQNILLSSGIDSSVILNIINPQDSQTLMTIVNGKIEYSMIHDVK